MLTLGHFVVEQYEHIVSDLIRQRAANYLMELDVDPSVHRSGAGHYTGRTYPRDPRQLSLGQSPNFLPVGRLSELGLSVACLQRTQISHGRGAA